MNRREEYRSYLQSDAWRQLRDQAIARSKGACEFCGDPVAEVHHVRYPKRFGDERLNDLVAVCSRCHELSHGREQMKVLTNAVAMKTFALSGVPFPYMVCDEARVWSTFEHWCSSLQVPPPIQKRFESGIIAAAAEGDDYKAQSESGTVVFRYHAAERALESLEHEYQIEQAREIHRKRWTKEECEAREILHRNYRQLRKWANDLQEAAIAGKLKERRNVTKGDALTPQMLVDAIREAVAPRLHHHDEQIAAHDLVIAAVKDAAPFLRGTKEFVTLRQAAMEIGIDPSLMPRFPESRLTVCQHAGKALIDKGAEKGSKKATRLDGSSVTAEMNTYRRGEAYAALREACENGAKPH